MDLPMDLIWDVAVKTSLVLAMLYAALWVMRRYYGKSGTPQRGPALMVVQSTQLGPGRSVHLIGIGDKMLLVGATSQQVSLLAEVDSADLAVEPKVATTHDSFEGQLRKAIEVAGALPARLMKRPSNRAIDGDPDTGDAE